MPTPSTIVRPADPTLRAAIRLASIFALVKLLVQFALTLYTTHLGYGYFRDEFYYLACGHHLALGYVDHGPIVALQARLGELLFGQSIFAIRIFSAAAGAAAIFLCGLLTWALGGRRSAQSLAMCALILAPQFISQGGYLSMNSFEPVFWSTAVLALILIIRPHADPGRLARYWILFGSSAGIGLLNKPSLTFFLIAIALGLLLTPQRRILFTRYASLGIALMIFIALPNVLWQITHHWPTLEFLSNGRLQHKNTIQTPVQFFLGQVFMMLPLTALLWITGLVSLLRARSIPPHRWLGLAALFFFPIMAALHAKDYYLAGIYPALFAAGAIAWEARFANRGLVRRESLLAFPGFEIALLLTALIALPLCSPVLRPETYVRYTRALHLAPGQSETAHNGPLPQFYADRFGWDELSSKVNAVFHSLSPADQAIACISTDNYGEAGAIDFFNRRDQLGLPPVISRHNSYWLWGPHGCTAQLAILVTEDTRDEILQKFESVTIVGHLDNPLIMPYEHKNIYLVRNRRPSAPFNWFNEHYFI